MSYNACLRLRLCTTFGRLVRYSVCEGSFLPRIHVSLRATGLVRYLCPPLGHLQRRSHLSLLVALALHRIPFLPLSLLCPPFCSWTGYNWSQFSYNGRGVARSFPHVFCRDFSCLVFFHSHKRKGFGPTLSCPNRHRQPPASNDSAAPCIGIARPAFLARLVKRPLQQKTKKKPGAAVQLEGPGGPKVPMGGKLLALTHEKGSTTRVFCTPFSSISSPFSSIPLVKARVDHHRGFVCRQHPV